VPGRRQRALVREKRRHPQFDGAFFIRGEQGTTAAPQRQQVIFFAKKKPFSVAGVFAEGWFRMSRKMVERKKRKNRA
jgi:hypothetical protein